MTRPIRVRPKLKFVTSLALMGLAACGPGGSAAHPGSKASPLTGDDLSTPVKKEIVLEILNSAENSDLHWQNAYSYCAHYDSRGYTSGIAGFTTNSRGATPNDGPGALGVLEEYDQLEPGNALTKYEAALPTADVTAIDNAGGGPGSFCQDWAAAASDTLFQEAQQHGMNVTAFDPAKNLAQADGLGVSGQAVFFDDAILNGYSGTPSLSADEACARSTAAPPSQGGDELTFLDAFLACYRGSIMSDPGHASDGAVGRVDTLYKPIIDSGNLGLDTPLSWSINNQSFQIQSDPTPDPTLSTDW